MEPSLLAQGLYELRLAGHCPSKKNLLKPRKRPGKDGRAFYYDPEVKAQLEALDEQVREQWGARPPLVHPAIGVHFVMESGRADRDNRLVTIMDCLVKGGALEDDCVNRSNGVYLIFAAQVAPTPMCIVWLQPEGLLEPLIRKMESFESLKPLPSGTLKRSRSRWK